MGQRPWVNYHHLLYFKTIAIEGGIAKASKKLRLGQPTLSTQMKQFEETLGHKLFDRSKRYLQLTEAGRLLLSYANEIFRMGDEMVDALNDHHVTTKIQVQIGVVDTVPKRLTVKVFHKAQEKHDCVVSISSGHNDELLRELRTHRIDLMVANYPPQIGEAAGFFARNIATMPVAICGSKKFAGLKRNFPASLNGQPFIMPSGQTKLRQDLEHYLKLRNISTDIIAEVHDTSVQKLMAVHGDGIIVLALPAAEELIESRELIMIGALQDVGEELWLIAAERRIHNPVAAAIMKDFAI